VNFDRYLPLDNNSQNSSQSAMGSAVAEKSALLPIELLKKLNLNGQLTIADLKVKNLTMQGVRLQVTAKDGVLQSQQSVNRLYQGAYNGKIVFDFNDNLPVLTLSQQLSHIQIGSLLTDLTGESHISGLIDLNAKLEATGNSDFALKSSLNGRLNLLGRELLIRGFNLQKIIDNGKIWLSSTPTSTDNKKDITFFSIVTGTGVISNGLLRNNDLSASANKANVGGFGVIDLVSQKLDYKIIAILLKEKITTTHAKVVNNLPIFINIGGTFTAPAYQVDLAAMGVGL
jgi:AsmA protein